MFLPGRLIQVASAMLVILFPSILGMPIAFGYRYNLFVRLCYLLPFLLGCVFQYIYIKKNNIKRPRLRSYGLIVLFLSIWMISMARSILSGGLRGTAFIIYDILVLIICFYLHLFSNIVLNPNKRLITLYAFGLYLVFNMALYGFGIRQDDLMYLVKFPSSIGALAGMDLNRTLFPMADGINSFGLIAGAVLAGSAVVFFFETDRLKRYAFLVVGFISIIIVLMADSRGSILFSSLTIALVIFWGKFPKLIISAALLISFTPLVAILFAPDFFVESKSVLNTFNRPSSNDSHVLEGVKEKDYLHCKSLQERYGGSLSNRPVIWSIAIEKLKDFELVHLVGYGYRGEAVSGLSAKYSCVFKNYSQAFLAPSHNIWLKLVMDIGYSGSLVTLFFMIRSFLRLSDLYLQYHDVSLRAMAGVLVYVLLVGMLEAALQPDFFILFIFVVSISITAFTFPDSDGLVVLLVGSNSA